jgi:Leucine-rich repeat (LRR) protein
MAIKKPRKICNEDRAPKVRDLARELESAEDPLAVEEIDWSHDEATAFPESACKFTNIKRLTLHACAYTSLPPAFGSLQKLEELDIGFSKLTSLPPTFGSLQRLRRLNLMSNNLTTLAGSFSHLKALDCLFLSFNGLETLPEDFGDLEALDMVSVAGNKLKSLPDSFGKLAKLTGCTLSWNPDLTSLPASFGNLAKLRWLEVKGIPELKFDDSLARLPALQYIYLDEHQAPTFPEKLKSALNSQGCRIYYECRIDDPYDDAYRTEIREF